MNRNVVGVLAIISVALCLNVQAGTKKKCDATVDECLAYMAKKYKDRGWVGIEYDHDAETGNMVIEHVIPDSPAFRADLRKNDHLVAVNGVPFATEDKQALEQAFKRWSPGDTVVYKVKRGKEQLVVNLELGQWPKDVVARWVGSHIVAHHMPAADCDD